jgi:hypothetical protein
MSARWSIALADVPLKPRGCARDLWDALVDVTTEPRASERDEADQ